MKIHENSIVIFKNVASVESLKEFSKYRAKGLPLKCPCDYVGGTKLKVVEVLSSRLLLLQPESSPHNLTISVIDDVSCIER